MKEKKKKKKKNFIKKETIMIRKVQNLIKLGHSVMLFDLINFIYNFLQEEAAI